MASCSTCSRAAAQQQDLGRRRRFPGGQRRPQWVLERGQRRGGGAAQATVSATGVATHGVAGQVALLPKPTTASDTRVAHTATAAAGTAAIASAQVANTDHGCVVGCATASATSATGAIGAAVSARAAATGIGSGRNGVQLGVSSAVAAGGEGTPAVQAREGLQARVREVVALQAVELCEVVAADMTNQEFLSSFSQGQPQK